MLKIELTKGQINKTSTVALRHKFFHLIDLIQRVPPSLTPTPHRLPPPQASTQPVRSGLHLSGTHPAPVRPRLRDEVSRPVCLLITAHA